MAIHVMMLRNPLRTGGTPLPRVVRRERIGFEMLLDYMSKDTALEKADMRATLEQLAGALSYFLSSGGMVETPIAVFSVGVRSRRATGRKGGLHGVVVDANDLHLLAAPSRSLLQKIRAAATIVVQDDEPAPIPVVTRVTNAEEWPGSSTAQIGQVIALRGARLRIDPRDDGTGVFFAVDRGAGKSFGGSAAVYRAEAYSRTGTACIDCRIPPMPAGAYRVQVRTRPAGKEIRAGSWNGLLTVLPDTVEPPVTEFRRT